MLHSFDEMNAFLQTLEWDCPAGLKNTEVLHVKVFDHEKIGKNK